jgi:aconitate hydratase 2/2-methylisocitrate dehydratase
MGVYKNYLKEIEERKIQGLKPMPIDGSKLVTEIIHQIKDSGHPHRKESIQFFIYNVLPGTTSAAGVKAKFLKEIILEEHKVEEISPEFAFELLSHMKGGPSIEYLLDLALGKNEIIANQAAEVIKTQVFLYEADTNKLEAAFNEGNKIAKSIIDSYSKAEFFY